MFDIYLEQGPSLDSERPSLLDMAEAHKLLPELGCPH